jgi:Domain of Unknown Function (DUF1080)
MKTTTSPSWLYMTKQSWFKYWVLLLLMIFSLDGFSQDKPIKFGTALPLVSAISNAKNEAVPLLWFNVNTSEDTWKVKGKELICTGKPIGVMRSEKQYENFILHVEWMHVEPGGNSGVFVWSKAQPEQESRLPDGVEVQMLELDWVNLNKQDGETPPIAYVHGELFGVGGVTTVPDNPRGTRSKSIENLCKGKGEWNTYDVVCVDGIIKLSVNGKFVNGISMSSQKKGYLCLESEGAEIHFRNFTIVELPGGVSKY